MTILKEIPQPIGLPLTGNLKDIVLGGSLREVFMRFARELGPIYRIRLLNQTYVIVSSHELVKEVCDQQHFEKRVNKVAEKARDFAGNGLLTAETNDPEWQKAHNILLPAFSMSAMQNYLPQMVEILNNMLTKWENNLQQEIDVVDQMTRLTLDTIGLCGFEQSFDSFMQEDLHPFINSLERCLVEAVSSAGRLPIQEPFRKKAQRLYESDIQEMHQLVDAVVRERQSHPPEQLNQRELLNLMLHGVDKATNEKLTPENIRNQIITFLVAGHDTTSSLLSFTLYQLLKHPTIMHKVYEEVVHILGTDINRYPTMSEINQMQYTKQVLSEVLRLSPPITAFSVRSHDDIIIGGQYALKKGEPVNILIPTLHRDTTVWGDNANIFDPENFAPDKVRERSGYAFKPFGNGKRACIGRQFAFTEAVLAISKIVQRYELIDCRQYELETTETISIKTKDFFLKVRKRPQPEKSIALKSTTTEQAEVMVSQDHETPLLILYGSNLGSAQTFAQQLATNGERQGYGTTLAPLDDYVDKLPQEGGVLIVCATFNGEPPDNAVQFHHWLSSVSSSQLTGVRYAVFGVGSTDWANTYQAIPKFIDKQLAAAGAERLLERGEANTQGDFFDAFEQWQQHTWQTLATVFEIELKETSNTEDPLYDISVVEMDHGQTVANAFKAVPMTILENRELCDTSVAYAGSKRHIEVQLPPHITYKTGDYLGVLGDNHEEQVERVATRFGLSLDTVIALYKNQAVPTNLPVDVPISVRELLTYYVELQEPATQQQIRQMLHYNQCPPERDKLATWAGTDEESRTLYQKEIKEPRVSLLDLLESHPATMMPFPIFLELLPTMSPRYYSISSSNLKKPNQVDLTVSVINTPAWSGNGQYKGLCSYHLSQIPAGKTTLAYVREVRSAFGPPTDPSTPMIMICAGTGLAPFRGFVEERAVLQEQGQTLGDALLFYGCRHPDFDFMYPEEWQQYEEQNLVQLLPAFSRQPQAPAKYVQDRLWLERQQIWSLLQQNAIIYICGEGRHMATAVKDTILRIYQENKPATLEEAATWLQNLERTERYVVDAWTG